MQQTLDHSLGNKHPTVSVKTVRQTLLTYDLVDSLRDLNPTTKDFTYYSAPHNTFTRIYHIFIQTPILPSVLSSTIRSISWSDHDAVLLTLTSQVVYGSDRFWTLNEYTFSDPGTQLLIRGAMQDYLALNTTPDVVGSSQGGHQASLYSTSFHPSEKQMEKERKLRQGSRSSIIGV